MPAIYFSSHSLHPPVITHADHKSSVSSKFSLDRVRRRSLAGPPLKSQSAATTLQIPLTTVSLAHNFDAYVAITYSGVPEDASTPLLLDSGSSVLVVPKWEDIAAIANWSSVYSILGSGNEPWGCPANIVKGPIDIITGDGTIFVLEDSIFYACTGDNPDPTQEARTANFGLGCLDPWSSSGWNTPLSGVTMQSPLSYNISHPYAEIDYSATADILGNASTPKVTQGSLLILYQSPPTRFKTFKIIPDLAWMSLIAKGLSIRKIKTGWPGTLVSPIAMIDTGGGPVFLSDPNGTIYSSSGNNAAVSPSWISLCTNCQCIRDPLTVELGDASDTISFLVDTNALPVSVAGLTLVMCENNYYMMKQQGMNIGGISCLSNSILIDYRNKRVGFKPR